MHGGGEIPEKTFGKFLVDAGVISSADLEEATQAMVLFGGRLGSSLVETRLLSVRSLEEQLGLYLGLEPAPEDWLGAPDAAAKAALATDLVMKHSAIPIALERRTLHLAMLDPRDLAATEALSFATGHRVAAYPVAECRFVHLLQSGYGVRPSVRFLNLMREDDEPEIELLVPSDSRRAERPAPREPSRPAPADAAQDVFGIEPIAADVELLDEATFDQIQAQSVAFAKSLESESKSEVGTSLAVPNARPELWELGEDEGPASPLSTPQTLPPTEAPTPAVPRPAPSDLHALEIALTAAGDREEIIESAVRLASAFSEAAALFVVRGDHATGAQAWRTGRWLPFSSGVAIPLTGDNLLARATRELQPCRLVPANATPIDLQLGRALGAAQEGSEIVAYPILLSGRVVNILVVSAGAAPLSQLSHAALGALAPRIAAAYEKLIVARKQQAA